MGARLVVLLNAYPRRRWSSPIEGDDDVVDDEVGFGHGHDLNDSVSFQGIKYTKILASNSLGAVPWT